MVEQIPHSQPLHDNADIEAARRTLVHQHPAAGAVARRLAGTLRMSFGGRAAATTASGTLGLFAACASLDIGAGDEVILPTYVCHEVADAVLYAGGTPVLCDIDLRTYSPSAATVAAVQTSRTRAVIIPHMFGMAAAVEEIATLGVPIIKDLAQGLGARIGDNIVGSFGAVTVLSFKAIKMVSSGEGGAVIARTPETADRLDALRARSDPHRPSFCFPMSDLTAAVAESQWGKLHDFIETRTRLAERYRTQLVGIERLGAHLPPSIVGHGWFRFVLTLPSGVALDIVREAIATYGVHVRRPVDGLLHRLWGMSDERFPAAVLAFESALSLPLYPAITQPQQERVVQAVAAVLERVAISKK